MDTTRYAHQRDQQSFSSSSSGGMRYKMNQFPSDHSITTAKISPPFQAYRQAGMKNVNYNGMPNAPAPPMNVGYSGFSSNGHTPGSLGGKGMSIASSNGGTSFGIGGTNGDLYGQDGVLNAGNSSNNSNGLSNGVQPNPSSRSRHRRPDTEEIKKVAHTHYEELFKFLKSHLAKGQRGPRTNAREKLTRLSQQQFTELSTDVYDELMRRITNARTGSEIPHLAVREEFHPKRNQARQKLATLPRTRFKDLSSDVFFELERRFPELRDEFRPEVSERERREEEEAAQRQRQRQNSILSARDEDISAHTVLPTVSDDLERTNRSPAQTNDAELAPQPSTSDVIVPAKSTLVEEQIALPLTDSAGEVTERLDLSSPSEAKDPNTSSEERPASIRDSIVTNEQDNNRSTMYSQASSVGTGFFNGYATSRATESVASPNLAARSSQAEGFQSYEVEKLRSDYEFRIATLQQKVTGLENRNTELEKENSERLEMLQSELDARRKSYLDKSQTYEKSLEEQRDLHGKTENELNETLKRLDELKERHESSNLIERGEQGQQFANLQRDYAEQEELVTELRGEVTNLMEELRQLSSRNDEILGDKENAQTIIQDLNNQVASYRRKYENAKTELRTLKATSQLYVQPPKTDEFMPPTKTGAIADINLTAFQSSIDDLVSAARSKTPSSVLMAMKTVILAATLVTDDVTRFEQNGGPESILQSNPESKEQISQAKTRISNTLNNLMTACRNHASSHGLSPVSLLDAAASHVSTAIVDIVKLVKVRKATKEEVDEFEVTFTQNGTLPNGLKPLLGSTNLANGAFSSPSTDFRRRNGVNGEAEERLLGTPGGVGGGGSGGGGNGENNGSNGGGTISNRSFSPRLRQGSTPLGRYSPVSYRGDTTRKNSSGEGSWKMNGVRSRNASISSNSSHQLQQSSSIVEKPMPAVPTISSDILRAAASSTHSISSSNAAPRSPTGNTIAQNSSSVSSGLQASIDEDLIGTRSFSYSSDRPNGNDGSNSQLETSRSGSINLNNHHPIPPTPPSLSDADDSNEAYWADLRNYIEVQTEAIVHCIQALLSSIREGAQGNQLHENLTQITTIVSSIIAISKDNIPRAAAAIAKQATVDDNMSASRAATASADGERILRELSEHCEKLIEMQTIGGQFDKTTKSNMASASYGVAKGLKALNGLLNLDG